MSDNLGQLGGGKFVETLNGTYIWQRELVVLSLFPGLSRVLEKPGRNLDTKSLSASDQTNL